jgi:hypothetical protein
MFKVINDNGRPWIVALVGSTLKFYDARFEHDNLGQFVASYYVSTIMEVDGGLDLYGGVPSWSLSPSAMRRIQAWLTSMLPAGQMVDYPLVDKIFD